MPQINQASFEAIQPELPTLIKEGGSNGIGTLRFTPAESMWSGRRNNWGVWDGMSIGDVPVFRDIEDVDSITA
jgi:hypothetical protein